MEKSLSHSVMIILVIVMDMQSREGSVELLWGETNALWLVDFSFGKGALYPTMDVNDLEPQVIVSSHGHF